MARCTKDVRTVCPSIHIYLALYGRGCIRRQSIDDTIPSLQQYRSTYFVPSIRPPSNSVVIREMCHRYWVGIQSSMAEEFGQTETR